MDERFENVEKSEEVPIIKDNSEMKDFFWSKQEKNIENVEVSDRLKALGVGEVHLEGVLEDWQYKIADSVDSMCKEYPEIVGKIGTIRTKKLPNGVYACAGPTMNTTKGFSSEIQVDSNKFSKHTLEWNVVGMEKENMFGERWLAGEGVDGLIKHEIGHIMHLNMIANEENLSMGEYSPEKYEKVYERFGHNAIATTICYDSIKELGISTKDIGKELSTYGKSNFGELFAESISEYESVKKPRRLAKKVHEKYEEYINNQGNQEIDVSKEIRSVVEKSVVESVIPVNKGSWEKDEHKGNSAFILDDNAEIKYQNKSINEITSISGFELKKQMMENYGTDRVMYDGNEPDFSQFEDTKLRHVELTDFSINRDGKDGTFHQAEQMVSLREGMTINEVRDYMKNNNLTWHECGDCKTVRAVPTVINSAFKHTGGISIERSKVAIAQTISGKYGDINLHHEGIQGKVKNEEVEKSLNIARKQYNETKKSL